ncbi:hypothetical protein BF49_1790 [Bradyrhizobium sp.]|nr:hypothetical protein BF49_1790 [Bradyrhizobium sp.]
MYFFFSKPVIRTVGLTVSVSDGLHPTLASVIAALTRLI